MSSAGVYKSFMSLSGSSDVVVAATVVVIEVGNAVELDEGIEATAKLVLSGIVPGCNAAAFTCVGIAFKAAK